MDFNSTVKGSLLEGFYPEGWDFEKIDKCCANAPESVGERQDFWNKDFTPIECKDVAEFDVKMGHEIANEIRKANAEKRKIAFILPVGPMGMYKWAVYFLKEWGQNADDSAQSPCAGHIRFDAQKRDGRYRNPKQAYRLHLDGKFK